MINKNFNIIDLVFPKVCGICGKINKQGLCNKCNLKIQSLAENKIIYKKANDVNYEELIYIFKYEGIIRKLILDYKFNEKSYIYETFVKITLKNEKIFEKMKTYDTIIPVPISKKRMKERGYNQSLLLAKMMSQTLKIPLETKCLYKVKNIIEQSKLNKEDRKQNIQNVYELKNKQILKNKRILLIDDIFTTGSTVNECSKILQKANPKKIDIFVLAKD